MSLVTTFSKLAQTLIGPGGLVEMPVTFTRVRPAESDYDALTGVVHAPAPLTWSAFASWSRREPTQALSRGTSMPVATRVLLVPGRSCVTAPEPGDAVTVAGTVYRVGNVTRVGDADGSTPPLYRVEVEA